MLMRHFGHSVGHLQYERQQDIDLTMAPLAEGDNNYSNDDASEAKDPKREERINDDSETEDDEESKPVFNTDDSSDLDGESKENDDNDNSSDSDHNSGESNGRGYASL